jgi:hypothetical protein
MPSGKFTFCEKRKSEKGAIVTTVKGYSGRLEDKQSVNVSVESYNLTIGKPREKCAQADGRHNSIS